MKRFLPLVAIVGFSLGIATPGFAGSFELSSVRCGRGYPNAAMLVDFGTGVDLRTHVNALHKADLSGRNAKASFVHVVLTETTSDRPAYMTLIRLDGRFEGEALKPEVNIYYCTMTGRYETGAGPLTILDNGGETEVSRYLLASCHSDQTIKGKLTRTAFSSCDETTVDPGRQAVYLADDDDCSGVFHTVNGLRCMLKK